MADAADVSVRITMVLKKYMAEADTPFEVLESVEQVVPLSSLPPEIQQQVMEAQNGGNDERGS